MDFENANEAQREAISTVDGPLLITAGPGTGKTFTLVLRAIYLIEECGVAPEQIFIATFTEKAAKELVTRITNKLIERNITANINEMYIGTFHSLCLRIIKEHIEYSRLKKTYRMLDDFDQKYTVLGHINDFRKIQNFDRVLKSPGAWKQAQRVCDYVNKLSEEMVDAKSLINDNDPYIATLGHVLQTYQEMLMKENLLDFSGIQTECFRMLTETPSILYELQNRFRYLMIDEYQDTNYIQEQLVFLLGKKHGNICVVGDDDQGLYRFRGATIRNILEFPERCRKKNRQCKVVALTVNYRSNRDIVNFYNSWMSNTKTPEFSFDWENFRYAKTIEPHRSSLSTPAVAGLFSRGDADDWHKQVLCFINKLKASGKLKNYNQLAFLFNSVKNSKVQELGKYLEDHGINVYSPRSDMFFKRKEIKLALGCLIRMFPKYEEGLDQKTFLFLSKDHYDYYNSCLSEAKVLLEKPEYIALKETVESFRKKHSELEKTTDYAYSGLLYRLFEHAPFSRMLDTQMAVGATDIRSTRNLAKLTQIIGKFEYLHNVTVLSKNRMDKDTEKLFNLYLRLLIDGGIPEYEDDSEYAPSGCVSFLTIHQSKGMEFPVVFVGSLDLIPKYYYDKLLKKIEDKYFHRTAFEPLNSIKYFDFWRKFYTAFSRAQDLLIMTDDNIPSEYFINVSASLPDVNSPNYLLDCFDFQSVKEVNLSNTFAFTSHITVYETCPLQYKFYKELDFMPVRNNAMLFGSLVHETIEDIHKAILRNEEKIVDKEHIARWFESNYESLVKTTHSYLSEQKKEAALGHVLRYADKQKNSWNLIKQAEVDVSLVKKNYIIEGKIDLIRGEGDTVEIVDFKSEKKPDMGTEILKRYYRQLQIYAFLVEQRTGQKVSGMHLYYTGEENNNPMISFRYNKAAIDGTMTEFDNIVDKILKKDFEHKCSDPKTCRNCDLRHYCKETR